MMTDLSRDHFSRPLGSSSRGAQADLEATESDSDENGGAPAAQRGRQFFFFLIYSFLLALILEQFYYFIHKTFVCIASKTLVPSVWHFIFLLLNTTSYIYLNLF